MGVSRGLVGANAFFGVAAFTIGRFTAPYRNDTKRYETIRNGTKWHGAVVMGASDFTWCWLSHK